MRSAPRSGTRMNFPVGSRIISWGCAASCLDGIVPLPFIDKANVCRADEPADRGNLKVEIVEVWPEFCE
jgi:hypothetical protein